jgi:alpha-tubulin suppressor-like RCC1 family protein
MRRLGLFFFSMMACTQTQELGADVAHDEPPPSFVPADAGASADAGTSADAGHGLYAFGVASGAGFTCATALGGGSADDVLCWGDNLTGQLGQPGGVLSSDEPLPVPGAAKIGSLAVGQSQVYAVAKAGGVTYWGAPLSFGNWVSRTGPQEIPALDDAVEVAVGQQHACAILKDASVVCWGENDLGQLGPGATSRSDFAVPVPGISDAIEISANFSNHTCVLRRDGGVLCWGSNTNGQLGDGNGGPGVFSRAPVAPVGLEPMAELAAGASSTCGVAATGKVFCWGDGRHGQLGTGPYAADYRSKVPVQVLGITDAKLITVSSHACVVRKNHGVSCWGPNDVGQLGVGTTDRADAPVELTGFDATQVSAGMDHTCAVRLDGQVWCWGGNTYGQLGVGHHGDGESSNVPQKVLVFTGIK